MATSQDKALKDKMRRLGYSTFEVRKEEVAMLYIRGHLICGVDYALSMSDEQLKALIDETVQYVS